VETRLSRRALLRGTAGAAAVAAFSGFGLSTAGSGVPDRGVRRHDLELDFAAVPKNRDDVVTTPVGYRQCRLGDPIAAGVPAYRNDGTDDPASFQYRVGDHHDGMSYFGLDDRGRWDPDSSDGGPHFNRRIHTLTEMRLSGPAARTPFMITKYSPDGSRTRGTVNNCANGETPWGTYLTCEENWAGYFRRIAATDNPNRTARELTAFARYGVAGNGRELWATVTPDTPDTPDDLYGRWNAMKLGVSADGSDDYRNVANTFGLNGITPANPADAFAGQADVVINLRLAADAAGATKMDRPEWGAVDPRNGHVYMTLTNTSASSRPIHRVDAANPRFYNDRRTTGQDQKGNPNGHIIRFAEDGGRNDATSFRWDVFLFGARATADPGNVNLSGLTEANDFSSPDGFWFSGANPGLLWIQTDDGAYTDVTNCMMLAALPGQVGDGQRRAVVNAVGSAQPGALSLSRGVAPDRSSGRRIAGAGAGPPPGRSIAAAPGTPTMAGTGRSAGDARRSPDVHPAGRAGAGRVAARRPAGAARALPGGRPGASVATLVTSLTSRSSSRRRYGGRNRPRRTRAVVRSRPK
jgi:secreted PhoX family phosphatase